MKQKRCCWNIRRKTNDLFRGIVHNYKIKFHKSQWGLIRKMETKINELTSWGLNDAIYSIIENGFYADEESGEIFFTSDDLDKLQETLDNKLNSICGWIKYNEHKAEGVEKRIQELKKNLDMYKRKQETLENYMKLFMNKNNITKKELNDYIVGFRKSSSVDIYDEKSALDFINKNTQYKDSCIKVETKTNLVKSELKKVMANETIPGVRIVEKQSIVIK